MATSGNSSSGGVPVLTPVSETSQLAGFDALVVVASSFAEGSLHAVLEPFAKAIALAQKIDSQASQAVTLLVNEAAPGGRLVLAPTGSLETETADVRSFGDAARKGVVRARDAGAVKPLLLVHSANVAHLNEYSKAVEVSLLSALAGLYEPLQARETVKDLEPVKELGFWLEKGDGKATAQIVAAMEEGRRVARDIGGSDPERMAPLRCADYIKEALKSGVVKVEIVTENLEKDYPLLSAVARASLHVERHRPVVVRLHYTGAGEKKDSLFFAGKGVTYDTGGADLKTGGHMAGMSRDKCGAANVAGFFKTLELLKPAHLDAYAELGWVRNSCGSDSYVSDEVITSHAGVRVSVGNTDAEGRMVLADCLSHCREKALTVKGVVPRLMTVCTLTGHAALSVGPYGITLDNSVAKKDRQSYALQDHGEVWGDPLEVTSLRREDVAFVAAKNKTFDLLQCNTAPSSGTPRGHQFPVAFIIKASGLDKHGVHSQQPLAYSQLDIAGGAIENMDYRFGNPTATPLVALTARYVLQ
jgi:leucyl aminopeptidase